VPNVLLFAGTGEAGALGARGPESGMRASVGASSRAKRDDATTQESRMPFRDDAPTQWKDRVADLLRTAQRSDATTVFVLVPRGRSYR